MGSSRRDHLVATALALFCRQGFRATGIDNVLRESGVAKKTLYNHFKSKDELILAVLDKRGEDFLGLLRESVARLAPAQEGDPRMAPVLAFFDGLHEWIRGDDFNGCTFINASAEYPRPDDPVHLACADHKEQLVRLLQELLADLQLQDAAAIARQLALLADGAIVNAYTAGDQQSAMYAKAAAGELLKSYMVAQGQGAFRRKAPA